MIVLISFGLLIDLRMVYTTRIHVLLSVGVGVPK